MNFSRAQADALKMAYKRDGILHTKGGQSFARSWGNYFAHNTVGAALMQHGFVDKVSMGYYKLTKQGWHWAELLVSEQYLGTVDGEYVTERARAEEAKRQRSAEEVRAAHKALGFAD